MKVIAVILLHNEYSYVQEIVEAIRSQNTQVEEIVIVDNSDLPQHHPVLKEADITYLRLDENSGVGHGHNWGWKYAVEVLKADYIWSIEHDAIPIGNCLDILMKHALAQRSMNWVFCPIEKNSLQHSKYRYYQLTSKGISKIPDKAKQDNYFGGLSFNGLLLPSTLLDSVGYLREDFFVGMEDIDFYTRIYEIGGKSLRVTSALVDHDLYKNRKRISVGKFVFLLNRSSGMRNYYSTRNGLYLQKEKGSNVLLRIPLILLNTFLTTPLQLRYKLRAIFDFWRGVKGKVNI